VAATTQYSPEYNQDKQAPALGLFDQSEYRLITRPFNFVQSGAGDAASICKLRFLPPGRILFFPLESYITWEAFGASRTLDIDFEAYTEPDEDAVTADTNLFDAAIDVSSAGGAAMGSDYTQANVANVGGMREFWSKSGVAIVATVAGGTIPDGTNLTGHLRIGIL
jgi:hypothetical protein